MENPGRTCTVCNARGRPGRIAKYVATSADRSQWYECGEHFATDNVLQTLRIQLEPIDDWFAALAEGD
jgi:hypothetical protein